MSIKRNNSLFLWLTIAFSIGQMWLSDVVPRWGLYSLIPYLFVLGIAAIYLKKDNIKFLDILPFNVGLKPVTALLIIALVFLFMPISSLLGELFGQIGGDMIAEFMKKSAFNERPFVETLFEMAVIPAIFEEICFRGFMFGAFKKARGSRFAIIFSAILFGFFHMNLQQLIYAAFLGIVLAVLREVTGSMWAGVLYHFINNGWSALYVFMDSTAPQDSFLRKLPLEQVTFFGKNGQPPTTGTLIFSIIMVIACTAVAIWLLMVIIKREGRFEDFKSGFFKKADAPKEKIVTGSLVIGIIIDLIIMASSFIVLYFNIQVPGM